MSNVGEDLIKLIIHHHGPALCLEPSGSSAVVGLLSAHDIPGPPASRLYEVLSQRILLQASLLQERLRCEDFRAETGAQ